MTQTNKPPPKLSKAERMALVYSGLVLLLVAIVLLFGPFLQSTTERNGQGELIRTVAAPREFTEVALLLLAGSLLMILLAINGLRVTRIGFGQFSADTGRSPDDGNQRAAQAAEEPEEGFVVKPGMGGSRKECKAHLRTFLSLKARVNYDHPAGFVDLMRVRVNGGILTGSRLVNKPLAAEMADGRAFHWFNSRNESWSIPYSNDFKSNYGHRNYGIESGDPYAFVFDISSIPPNEGNLYEILVEHNGKTGNKAYENEVVAESIETF